MIWIFKKYSVTFLNEKWEVVREGVKIKHIPRANELVFLPEHNKYFRVANVIHNFNGEQNIFIIIEEYTDDFTLLEKQKKK